MKKKKVIIPIIIGILLIVIVVCVILMVKNNNPKKEKSKEKEEEWINEPLIPTYETKDEVVAYIESRGDTATYKEEKDGCWYFESPERDYEYCQSDDVIRATDKSYNKNES